jgi:hypothetical protein
MDSEKLSFFQARFSSFDTDALAELNERRESLAEEACAALDQVLSDKGLSATMLSRFPTVKAELAAGRIAIHWSTFTYGFSKSAGEYFANLAICVCPCVHFGMVGSW